MKNINNDHFGLSDDDLIFLFGKHKNKAVKSLEALQASHPEYTDFDAIDVLSHGHGREAYVKLSNHRIQSEEYIDNFQIMANRKYFDLKTKEGKERHIYRNKNQCGKAPKDLKTMKEFVKRGYFIEEGYNPCHNMRNDTKDERKATISRMIYLVKHHILMSSIDSGLGNLSFRGTPGSSFEGCQFIYNDKTGELVTDSINRGTWDYGKYGTPSHYVFDVSPWIEEGNGNNVEMPEMFIMSRKDEEMYLKTSCKLFEAAKAQELGLKTAEAIKQGMKSSEAVKIDGSFVLSERNKQHEKSIEEIDINFINRCSEMPLSFLDPDWNSYISFCTMVDDKSLIAGLETFVNSMDSEPTSLKSLITDENKAKYKFFLIQSSFKCIDQEFKAGMEVKNDLPIILTINMNSGFANRLKNMGNQDEAIKEYHHIRDELLIPAISEKLGAIGFKCRVLDDVTGPNSYDSFKLTISQRRSISQEEAVLINNAKSKIPAKEEFAKEELNVYHAPEYSIEGALGSFFVGFGISTLVVTVTIIIGMLFDKLIWSKNRRIIKIIQDHIDVISEPINNDFAKYTILYNKLLKDASFINSLYTSDRYGKYQYETDNSRFSKDSFLRVDAAGFANDIVTKLFYAFKAMKNKNPKEIKEIFDNIQYTYVAAEGKPLLDLVTQYNGTRAMYDPVTGAYNKDSDEDSGPSAEKVYRAGALNSTYKATKRFIKMDCDAMSRKGFDILPVFFVNGSSHRLTDNLFDSATDPKNTISIDVIFYLCMHTSITYDKFLELKNIVDEEMAKPEEKTK